MNDPNLDNLTSYIWGTNNTLMSRDNLEKNVFNVLDRKNMHGPLLNAHKHLEIPKMLEITLGQTQTYNARWIVGEQTKSSC
jgi:hypothetical protein